jgi:hypothetical protein
MKLPMSKLFRNIGPDTDTPLGGTCLTYAMLEAGAALNMTLFIMGARTQGH